MSFISPPPPPLGTAHLTGKVSPPRQSFSRRTDAAAIARQIAREGFRGFLLLCSSLIPWSCGAKPRDGPYDIHCQSSFFQVFERCTFLPFSASFPGSISLTRIRITVVSRSPQVFISRLFRRRCARHLEPGKMHIRDCPFMTSSRCIDPGFSILHRQCSANRD